MAKGAAFFRGKKGSRLKALDQETVTQTKAVCRRFWMRTGALSLVALLGTAPLMFVGAGFEQLGFGLFLGALTGTVASWGCAVLLTLSASGRFIGSVGAQPILATAFSALIRIVALGIALVVARLVQFGGVRADVLTVGLTFMGLFAIFRVSEIFFIQSINALSPLAAEETSALEPSESATVDEASEPSTSSQESQP